MPLPAFLGTDDISIDYQRQYARGLLSTLDEAQKELGKEAGDKAQLLSLAELAILGICTGKPVADLPEPQAGILASTIDAWRGDLTPADKAALSPEAQIAVLAGKIAGWNMWTAAGIITRRALSATTATTTTNTANTAQ